MKTNLKKVAAKYRHGCWLLVYLLLQAGYLITNRYFEPKYMIHSPIDDVISFLPVFIVPYLIWYLYVGGAFVYFLFFSKADFYRLCMLVFAGMSIATVCFALFPNGIDFRPQVTGSDIFSRLTAIIFASDNPQNCCPSIHVINSMAVNIACCKSPLFKGKTATLFWCTVLNVLICLSTLFVKQHSFVDLYVALIVIGVVAIFVYGIKWPFLKESAKS